ncbi:MAG: hypothetical protein BA867_08695 [Desulfobacterales bacterium S5133MH16]|nr:MAG: hypothetical protein BA867_08695 [Desulfobacterales bacterium S5133MH16]
MKSLLLFFVIIFGLAEICYADAWTKRDTAYQATFMALQVMDWLQTKEIARNPRHIELNPILGKYPSQTKVDLYFLSTTLLHTGVAYVLPQKYRRYWQYFFIGTQVGCVVRNYRLGVRLHF